MSSLKLLRHDSKDSVRWSCAPPPPSTSPSSSPPGEELPEAPRVPSIASGTSSCDSMRVRGAHSIGSGCGDG
eukprot:2938294-Prymnesium_polylepis.2